MFVATSIPPGTAFKAAPRAGPSAGPVRPRPSLRPLRAQPDGAPVPVPIPDSALALEEAIGTGFDPEGLLGNKAGGGHFARKERERAAAEGRIIPLPVGQRERGILVSDMDAAARKDLSRRLAASYMPVNLDLPGLRLRHVEPPVFTLPGFFSREQCHGMIEAGVASGEMKESLIGAGNATNLYGNQTNSRRTSTSFVLDDAAVSRHASLKPFVALMHARGNEVLPVGDGWGPAGKLPEHRQYCFESLQIAKYERGQYFKSHEDGFPAPLVAQNGFQRHATLLLYLNGPAEGGATRFDRLELEVRPEEGAALLFFPATSDSKSDPRSLHTACDAGDVKWVSQQWVARGYDARVAAAEQREAEDKIEAEKLLAVNKAKKKPRAAVGKAPGGFGAKKK